MKKGCFYSFITVFTILVALGYYTVKHNKALFLKFGKGKMITFINRDLNNKIDKSIYSPYKDSLKILLSDYSNKIEPGNADSIWNNYIRFTKRLKYLIENKKVDSLDFIELKKIVKENERPTKN